MTYWKNHGEVESEYNCLDLVDKWPSHDGIVSHKSANYMEGSDLCHLYFIRTQCKWKLYDTFVDNDSTTKTLKMSFNCLKLPGRDPHLCESLMREYVCCTPIVD